MAGEEGAGVPQPYGVDVGEGDGGARGAAREQPLNDDRLGGAHAPESLKVAAEVARGEGCVVPACMHAGENAYSSRSALAREKLPCRVWLLHECF